MDGSVYDRHAQQLNVLGYGPALPINGKKPVAYNPGRQELEGLTGWTHPQFRQRTTPQPNAGVGIRHGSQPGGHYLVGVDFDDDDIACAAMSVFDCKVAKRGARGLTAYFQSPVPVAGKNFRTPEGKMLLQVLSDGTQSVLPPSIHPDTQQEYEWINGGTLYDTPLQELPLWPANGFELAH